MHARAVRRYTRGMTPRASSCWLVAALLAAACGGAPATTTTTPTDNVEPPPVERPPAIATSLTVAEYNGLVERGELRLLGVRPTSTPIPAGSQAVPGRVLADGDVVSADVCAGVVTLVVDRGNHVYAIVDVSLDGALITNALGNVPAIECQTQRFQLEPGQVFAHTIEITDYREFLDAASATDE
jgi:hypothetical protein